MTSRHTLMPGAGEYFLPGYREQCVILVHGYTGTPGELRLLGDYLNKQGYPVFGALLPGHGTDVHDLADKTFTDWTDYLMDKVMLAASRYSKVSLVGTSMGASVSLRVAEDGPIHKLVTLSAPIETFDEHHQFAGEFYQEHPYISKPWHPFEGIDEKYYQSYHSYPLRPLYTAFLEIDKMPEGELAKVTCPILIMQSKVEKTVKPVSAKIIYNAVGSKEKEIAWFNNSGHILALGPERHDVYKKVDNFLEKNEPEEGERNI